MDARHDDPELDAAENNPNYRGTLDCKLVRALAKTMIIVRSMVRNETQLYGFRGLHFEQLKGDRSHQYSMRLDKKWRLIVEFEQHPGPNSNVCVVKGIENYHKG